jgi:thiamine biosynthesis lipoprotein
LATSGDYERFFELEGKRFCHILNPKTGHPVQAWQSVSVLAPLAIVAGSCSTCAMLQEEAGLDYLNASGFSYLAVDSKGQIHKK